MTKPNLVFVFADQLRAQALGYAGDPNVETPNIDRLAAQSVDFTNAVSGHPVCCPYRASFLTGKYPLGHGLFVNDVPIGREHRSIAQVLSGAGYDTAYIGKWHVYGSPDGAYGRRGARIPKEDRLGFEYWRAFECCHNYMESWYFEGDDQERKQWEGYDAVAQTADACTYLRGRSSEDDPFLLVLSWGTPHDPYKLMPQEYLNRFADREIELRPNVPAECADQARENLRGYYAHTSAIDDCVGELLSTLEENGLAQNTIFVFTSDHGDMHRSQGLIAKHVPWDESIRVPFLLRWPETLGGERRELSTPLDAPDLMPTLLGLCGVESPSEVEGRDFSPEIRGEVAPDPDAAAFLNFPVPYGMILNQGLPEYRGVRTARYTYVRSPKGLNLLYDNEADPYQMTNLFGRPECRDMQEHLEAKLQEFLTELGDEFLPGEVYLEEFGYTHYKEAQGPGGRRANPWPDWLLAQER